MESLDDDRSAQWEQLYAAQSDAVNPFASPIWVTAWYHHYIPGAQQRLLSISHQGRLIGVAPLYYQEISLGPFSVTRRLQLVGAGRSTPLELPPLLSAPDQGRAVTRALVEEGLPAEVTWAELCPSPEHGWLATQDMATRDGQPVFSQYHNVRACVVLPLEPTWEETRARLRRNVKESVRRSLNRLAKDGRPWAIHHRTGTELDDEVVERLLRLHRARSQYADTAARHHDAFADTTTTAFLHDVLPRLGRAHQASVVELELDGHIVAAQLVLQAPGGIYFHSSGFLPSVWSLSPITALQVDAMRAAIDRGDRWVNFSPGPNESKLRWSEHMLVWNDVAVGPARRGALARYAAFCLAQSTRQLNHERHREVNALSARIRRTGEAR